MKHKPLIFISYSRKDYGLISTYLSALELKYTLWIDKTGIESSDEFKEKIVNAIKACDYFIFFSSKSSNESEWTAKEVGLAVSLKKTIIPIKLDSSPYNSSVAFDLININYSDDSEEQHLFSILNSIEILEHSRKRKKRISFGSLCALLLIILTSFLWIVAKNQQPPARGKILDEFGAVLAHSVIKDTTSLIINCTVGPDSKWEREAKEFSGELAQLCPEFNAYQYYSKLQFGREQNIQYFILVKKISTNTYNQVKELPFFHGYRARRLIKVPEKQFIRVYPQKGLARRTIGHFNPSLTYETSSQIPGLEGSFFNELKTFDLRTTLNVDFQKVSEQIVQNAFSQTENLESVCLSIMDIHTGAIKTIVNLNRQNKDDIARENYNMYVAAKFEPGALFLPISYALLLENKAIDINSLIARYSMDDTNNPLYFSNHDINSFPFERFNKIGVDSTSILLSNSLCKYLIYNAYSDNYKEYYTALDRLELLSPPPFDIRADVNAVYLDPTNDNWNASTLLQNCCGYGIAIPPISLHSFYNTIANGGMYSKPYLSECLERSGKVKDNLIGNKISKRIISKSDAQKIHAALMNLITTGTAANNFRDSNTLVAGATGASRIAVDGKYDHGLAKKYNYSFIGYFPADNPQFSILVMCSTFLSEKDSMPSGLQAEIANQVVDTLYNMNPQLIYR